MASASAVGSDPRSIQLRSEVGPWTTALGGLGDMLHTANPVEDLERVKGKLENLAPVDVKAGSKMAGDPSSILGSAGGAVQGAGGAEGISALFAASDERLKMNIKRSAMDALPGVPWASWEYKTDPGVRCYGVIAQDLEKVAPQFVFYRDDGMRMVNYAFIVE